MQKAKKLIAAFLKNTYKYTMRLSVQYLTFFFLLAFKSLYAQQIDYRKNYYPLINKAELAITEGKQAIALTNYLEAFNKVPEPFSKDLYNAALCAAISNNTKIAVVLCKSLVLKGTEITFILAQNAFRALEQSQEWQAFIESYPALRKMFLLKVNMPLRKELELMWARDQHYRIKPNGLLIYKDTIKAIDRENIRDLKRIIDKYTFPDESLIGVENPLEAPPFHSILYHHCQNTGNNSSSGLADFPNVLIDAVKHGQLSPHRYAAYADIQGKPIYGNTTFYRIGKNGELRYLKMKESEIKRMNKKRISIGLAPIGVYRKKVLFSLKNKNFIFDFNDSIIVLEGLDSKSIEEFLEHTNTIKAE